MYQMPNGRGRLPAVSKLGLLLMFVALLPKVIELMGELLAPLVPAVLAVGGLWLVWWVVHRIRQRY